MAFILSATVSIMMIHLCASQLSHMHDGNHSFNCSHIFLQIVSYYIHLPKSLHVILGNKFKHYSTRTSLILIIYMQMVADGYIG